MSYWEGGRKGSEGLSKKSGRRGRYEEVEAPSWDIPSQSLGAKRLDDFAYHPGPGGRRTDDGGGKKGSWLKL